MATEFELETVSLFNDIDVIDEKNNIKPCDYKSRVWCMRMCALFVIIIMLIIMIMNTFDYYSDMMKDMDELVALTPTAVSLYDECKTQNYNLVKHADGKYIIPYIPDQLATMFIQIIPYMNYSLNDNIITLNKTSTCFNIIVWGIV